LKSTLLTEFVIGAPVEPASISALSVIGSHFPEHTPIHLIFDSLVQLKPDGSVGPKLAEKWEISPDGLTYTFTLRPNARFHDGQPVTAEDVKFTFDALIDPGVKNVDRQGLDKVAQTEVVSPRVVRVRMKSVDALFLPQGGSHGIVPKHLLAGKNPTNDEFNRNPIGSGPYKLARWTPGQSIVMEAVPDHYRGTPAIKRVVFKILTDQNVLLTQLRSGEVHYGLIAPKDFDSIKALPNRQVVEATPVRFYDIIPNYSRAYWQDQRVREAVIHGIDRKALVDKVLAGHGQVVDSNVAPSSWAFNPNVLKRPFDPTRAKALLEDAGWKSGSDGIRQKDGQKLSFSMMLINTEPTLGQVFVVVQQYLREIGMDMKIDSVEYNTFYERQGKSNFDALARLWNPVWDPQQHSTVVTGNWYGYSNPKVDQLSTSALATLDREKRKQAYLEIQEILANDAVRMFLYTENELHALPTGFTGIQPHPVNIFWNLNEWK
jgi:peptide/nickel transport system substrate-binding protein